MVWPVVDEAHKPTGALPELSCADLHHLPLAAQWRSHNIGTTNVFHGRRVVIGKQTGARTQWSSDSVSPEMWTERHTGTVS